MTEDEMVGWHHPLDGLEFEQALGVGDGQGSLASCSPQGHKEPDMTERLNWTERTLINTMGNEKFTVFHVFLAFIFFLNDKHITLLAEK